MSCTVGVVYNMIQRMLQEPILPLAAGHLHEGGGGGTLREEEIGRRGGGGGGGGGRGIGTYIVHVQVHDYYLTMHMHGPSNGMYRH